MPLWHGYAGRMVETSLALEGADCLFMMKQKLRDAKCSFQDGWNRMIEYHTFYQPWICIYFP